MLFKASAPGSLMLLGEYAVLQGHLALVCAVDKRITVELTPCDEHTISIHSVLGDMQIELSQLEIKPPFQFVLATLKKYQKKIRTGCRIKITSEFSDQIGFGSSAAVTVATLSVLNAWLKLSLTDLDLIRMGRSIIRKVQGLGSGADIAASVLGGIVAFRAQPLSAERLPYTYPLVAVYSGSKTPTKIAVKQVENAFLKTPQLYQQICKTIGVGSQLGKEAILAENWVELGKIMNIQQGLMSALGVATTELQTIVYNLNKYSSILGAKISGSGFGDCAIGLGEVDNNITTLPINIANKGVCCSE